jgi:hypothetical protein
MECNRYYNFEGAYIRNGASLTVNWFKKKEPFDFDEIQETIEVLERL